MNNINRSKVFREKLEDDYNNFQNLKLFLYLAGLNEASDYIFKDASDDFKYTKSNNALNKTLEEYFNYLDEEFTNSQLSFSINMNNYNDYLHGALYLNLKSIIDFILTEDYFKDYFIYTVSISDRLNSSDSDSNKSMEYYDYSSFISQYSKILSVKNYLSDSAIVEEYFNSLTSYEKLYLEFDYSIPIIVGGSIDCSSRLSNSLDGDYMPPHLLECLSEITSNSFLKRIFLGEDLIVYTGRRFRRMNEDEEFKYFYLLDFIAYFCLKFNINFHSFYESLIAPIIKDTLATSKSTRKLYNFI